MDAIVGLGSNLGSREALLRVAARLLGAEPEIEVRALSRIYETPALGPPQPDFLNAAARVRTALAPRALLARMHGIEAHLGRVRRERWGPRTIDLDLLWWEGGGVREADLVVPHPGLLERSFALAPLLELGPELRAYAIDGVALGDRLAELAVPPARPWASVERVDGRLEVRGSDDADALALAVDAALGSGSGYGDVRVIHAPTALDLVAEASREARGGRGWLIVESVREGGIRARFAVDPRRVEGLPAFALASFSAGRAVIKCDPAPK